jgi:hypothetical protein
MRHDRVIFHDAWIGAKTLTNLNVPAPDASENSCPCTAMHVLLGCGFSGSGRPSAVSTSAVSVVSALVVSASAVSASAVSTLSVGPSPPSVHIALCSAFSFFFSSSRQSTSFVSNTFSVPGRSTGLAGLPVTQVLPSDAP